ncbi:phosphate butyryltransferase [Enterococcus florum]|uniref:Phosphate butyryltransferase n=1 Tax=Enterococcus florum TaxID=2480627 RepID=A0A4P5PCJ4_9ENTE|nr:phosphate acyltransferase [Enterococcus florum]GCF95556.1 phosphate butyryltransferase [Enterococcus florum]
MKKFEELLANFSSEKKIRIGVVCANDKVTIQSVFNEKVRAFLDPVLIGEAATIITLLGELGETATVVEAASEEECAAIGVQMVKNREIDFLMKGHIQTRTFLKAVVNKEDGIAKSGLLSHVALNEIPAYHKLLLTTDGGMVLAPSKEEKKILIDHGVQVMNKIGIAKPKVGLLAAAENVNPKVASTIEAEELMKEIQAETPDKCFIDGPISLDLSLSPVVAELKHYNSPVAGDADIVVGPDITTMNVLGKSLTILAGAKMAGIIMGAAVPIVMTSRGSTEEEKAYSILVAMYCSKED